MRPIVSFFWESPTRLTIQEMVLSSIDKGLDAVGEDAKHVLYFYLERKAHIGREDIVAEPEKFMMVLQNIFGPGSAVLERNIMLHLQEKSQGRALPNNFPGAVAALIRHYSQ